MNVTSYNKMVLENKFLVEHFIHKLQETGELSEKEKPEVFFLFRKTLVYCKEESPEERLQLLVKAFSEYLENKKNIFDNTTHKEELDKNKEDNLGLPEDLFESDKQLKPNQKNNNSKDFILRSVDNLLKAHSEIPADLKEKARKYLLAEAEAISGTGVNERVVDRFMEVSISTFKKKEKLINIEQKISTRDEPKEPASEEIDSENKIEADSIVKNDVKTVTSKISTKPEVLKDNDIIEEKDENIVSTTSVKNDLEKDSDFQIHVTSENSRTVDGGISKEKKSLAQIMLERARIADKTNPLVSHQREIEIPARRSKTKKFERSEVVPNEDVVKTHRASRPIVPQVDGTGEVKLSSASNTKVSFDEKINLEPDSILERHDLRQQQKTLFNKYLAEQIDTVIEVVSGNGVSGEEAQQKLREEIMRDAQKIIKNDKLSISKKLHDLDDMFTKKRHRYAAANQIQATASIEELIDPVMARAGQDIRTNDPEADARFRETLRDTLLFKAKHLFGANMDKNKIQSALDEEYVKHKMFYLKKTK